MLGHTHLDYSTYALKLKTTPLVKCSPSPLSMLVNLFGSMANFMSGQHCSGGRRDCFTNGRGTLNFGMPSALTVLQPIVAGSVMVAEQTNSSPSSTYLKSNQGEHERTATKACRKECRTWTRDTWPAWGVDPAGRPRCPRNWWRSGLGRGRPAPDCSAWTRQSWATEEPRSSSGANTGTSRGKSPHAPQPKSSRTSTSSPARLRGQHSDKA